MEINGVVITHANIRGLKCWYGNGKLDLEDEVCLTCQHCNICTGYCDYLENYSMDNYDFVCDSYKRRNSGAYRRQRRKQRKLKQWATRKK